MPRYVFLDTRRRGHPFSRAHISMVSVCYASSKLSAHMVLPFSDFPDSASGAWRDSVVAALVSNARNLERFSPPAKKPPR